MRSLALIGAVLAATAVPAQATIESERGPIRVERLAVGLDHPWGMAFLPDGRLLVTERAGRLRVMESGGELSEPLSGVPEVVAKGQGGLLDVALDPDFASNRLIYLSFAEAGEGGVGTALGRGVLGEGKIEDFEVIFRQQPKVDGPHHFGGRIAFASDGNLFLTLGERFKFDPAQDPSNHLGAVVRLRPDGQVPPDNPFVGQRGRAEEIWSYGHRNVEAAAVHPKTGALWIAEMGPQDGDELNLPQAGGNYGWPLVSWGRHYDGEDIPNPDTRPDLADAIRHWTPVISPSGMLFYQGDAFPDWRGSALIGGLSSQGLVRLENDGERVSAEERIALGERIRDVEQGPDGAVYALTDSDEGAVLRLTPAG